MPKIDQDIDIFTEAHAATTVKPLPKEANVIPGRPAAWGFNPAGKQRGPSCGFYALSFICNFWFTRFNSDYAGLAQPLAKPLPPRTNLDVPAVRRTEEQRLAKAAGEPTSLRQIGKKIDATLIGSMFNAADLLRVAEAVGYDGKVIQTIDPGDLVTRLKWFITRNIPVAVPYDANSGTGDPGTSTGTHAHWAVVAGFYEDSGKTYAITQHWLKYYYCEATALADSCHQLTSNETVEFKKVEVVGTKGGVVQKRDFVKTATLATAPPKDTTRTVLPPPGAAFGEYLKLNPENCEPGGIDPSKVGLRRKIVPIYPKLSDTVANMLANAAGKAQLLRIFGTEDVAAL